jgi:hypothetical protein
MKQSNHRLISLADYAGEENGHLKGRICEKRIFPITTVYLIFITPSLQTSCLCFWHKGIDRANDRLQQQIVCPKNRLPLSTSIRMVASRGDVAYYTHSFLSTPL